MSDKKKISDDDLKKMSGGATTMQENVGDTNTGQNTGVEEVDNVDNTPNTKPGQTFTHKQKRPL